MPKLFALAEREGIAEHTGMTRAAGLIVSGRPPPGGARRSGPRLRDTARSAAGTAYGFLRAPALATTSPRRKTFYVSPSQIRRLGLQKPGLVVEGPIRLRDRGAGRISP